MPSTISKKIAKSTAGSSQGIKGVGKRRAMVVDVHASKGTVTAARFDAIAKEQGARSLTPQERQQFRGFAKTLFPDQGATPIDGAGHFSSELDLRLFR